MAEPSSKLADYVDRTAELIDLPLDPEHRLGVIDNMAKISAIAQLVLDFPVPDTLEAAPTFQP